MAQRASCTHHVVHPNLILTHPNPVVINHPLTALGRVSSAHSREENDGAWSNCTSPDEFHPVPRQSSFSHPRQADAWVLIGEPATLSPREEHCRRNLARHE